MQNSRLLQLRTRAGVEANRLKRVRTSSRLIKQTRRGFQLTAKERSNKVKILFGIATGIIATLAGQ